MYLQSKYKIPKVSEVCFINCSHILYFTFMGVFGGGGVISGHVFNFQNFFLKINLKLIFVI